MVGSTLDLHTTARELCAVTVPRFADSAAVLVVDHLFSDGEPRTEGRSAGTVLIRRVAAVYGEPRPRWDAALPEDELITLPADAVVPGGRGETVLVPVVDPAIAPGVAQDLGVPALGPLLAGCSLVVAPLTARGTVLGRIGFLRGPGRRPFDSRDVVTATELAASGAVHLDNARLHRQESQAAATLQRSMMPTRPPRIPGVRIAHHYMPGDRQAQVGGDWFDAIQLPGGRVALIVGDVMGHGLQAAAVMGQFRTAVITMAALDLPPAQLLRHLDNLAHRLSSEHLATCVYAVYDPIHRTLSIANAGHIPPVLAGSDGRGELLDIPGGAPIGVGGVPFETVELSAPDGSWLVLCTDGLVEVRGQGIDAGLAALCANVIEPQQSPEDVCAQILAQVHSEDRGDDVALLVARFEGVDPQDVVRWTLLVNDGEVSRARELTRRQLAAWGLERLSDTAELLVSELVTNAIKAASYEVELRLMRVGKLLVEVSDDNHNLPQLQRADADDVGGRGLALVSHLSRRWGTSRKAVGKVVWFELPLPS
ncbi:ATP-binding SpoIIE family protein phosphatase [Actinacidiphila yeochonensis]|uniref:ATP-binding SpoIIE family protein phosphatase n=1 Tax=Actinacidiphila yeochonensis TaxID=89050 RepID=UPI0007C6416D|nr:SpoIIE family protein phosphatase [Actinacidiphila yeochonensis]